MQKWKWDGNYPVRCKIVDVTGQEVAPGWMGTTPSVSKPHVGKEGTAEMDGPFNVKITLDDGAILYGIQCWWEALPPKEKECQGMMLDKAEVLKAIADEPEYPGEAPPELTELINKLMEIEDPQYRTETFVGMMRLAVKQTKECITERIQTLKTYGPHEESAPVSTGPDDGNFAA